jgi:Family of unknown function (DUF6804)
MNVSITLHWMPAVMLIAALGPWPYAYYTLLRVVVCLAAGLLALTTYQRSNKVTLWFAAFVGTSILFNPIFPIHLTRGLWTVLDLAGAALFVVHFFVRGDEAWPD